MGRGCSRRIARGFTLIELIVVTSIIVLLVGILLPSLRRARERAKQVACLSNLRQIGHATSMYMTDHNEMVPLGPSDTVSTIQTEDGPVVANLTTCHWGGRRAGWQHGPTPEVEKRPLTGYLYPRATLDADTPVFHCPSDRPTEWSQPIVPGASIYRVCGNSYYLNMFGKNPVDKRVPSASASQVIVFMEAPLHELLAKTEQGMGWHRQFSTHNVAFLDMHAESVYVDSRHRSGVRWNVSDFIAMDGIGQ